MLAHARHRQFHFTMVDLMIVVTIMAIVTAVAMPLVSAAGDQAKATTLQQNLHMLRSQIELYKLEHRGDIPLLYQGTFPQLTEATNVQGIPGPAGKNFPLGPYMRTIPTNPYTGVSVITPVETFPPTQATKVGGWLYHQATGQIAPDLADGYDD